jgi:hypothetical protein
MTSSKCPRRSYSWTIDANSSAWTMMFNPQISA